MENSKKCTARVPFQDKEYNYITEMLKLEEMKSVNFLWKMFKRASEK